jgi:hypothetical protein
MGELKSPSRAFMWLELCPAASTTGKSKRRQPTHVDFACAHTRSVKYTSNSYPVYFRVHFRQSKSVSHGPPWPPPRSWTLTPSSPTTKVPFSSIVSSQSSKPETVAYLLMLSVWLSPNPRKASTWTGIPAWLAHYKMRHQMIRWRK